MHEEDKPLGIKGIEEDVDGIGTASGALHHKTVCRRLVDHRCFKELPDKLIDRQPIAKPAKKEPVVRQSIPVLFRSCGMFVSGWFSWK